MQSPGSLSDGVKTSLDCNFVHYKEERREWKCTILTFFRVDKIKYLVNVGVSFHEN